MQREELIQKIKSEELFDLLIIGGGSIGLGTALDASLRGLKVCLIERQDYCSGTSSKSTKLLHGGVRYLEQGRINLVREALKERGIIKKIAPHLFHELRTIIPLRNWFQMCYYYVGLKCYDLLAGTLGLIPTTVVNQEKLSAFLPNLIKENFVGGLGYSDGQFDDSRYGIALLKSAASQGALSINYCSVEGVTKSQNEVFEVTIKDVISKTELKVRSKLVVNATGVFTDEILNRLYPERKSVVKPSQGTHIVLSQSFLGKERGLIVPKTKDGRVVFLIPWHHHLIVGTTDTPLTEISNHPVPLNSEINYLLDTIEPYLDKKPSINDVKSVWAGLRPLVAPEGDEIKTKDISRKHRIFESKEGIINVVGGKWTTYRLIAEEVVNKCVKALELPYPASSTKSYKLFGSSNGVPLHGFDTESLRLIIEENPLYKKEISAKFPYKIAHVIYCVRYEQAIKLEDVLARRMRILFLDADEARKIASTVVNIMANELIDFNKVASTYMVK